MLFGIIIKQEIQSSQPKEKTRKHFGWTIFAILIIATVLLIWISLPSGICDLNNGRAQEAVLKENLFRMREMINQYKSDNGYYRKIWKFLSNKAI
jgi:hypothetical protein